MKAYLKSWLKKEQQEDLHRFRVQVKKLLAFLILTDSAGEHRKLINRFKAVKNIFKQAGVIRNAYMNRELAEAQQIHDAAFMNNQFQLQVKASQKFKSKKAGFFRKIKGSYQTLKRKIAPISDLHIDLYYETQLKQIAFILAEPQFDERLHQCRKQAKNLIYNHKLIQRAPGSGFNTAYLEQVQTTIGDWHDHVLAIKLFSNNAANDRAAVTRLKRRETKLKQDIIALTEDFYNRATTVVSIQVEQLS